MNGNLRDSEQGIETYLDGMIESGKIPGIQYLVMNEDKILFEYNGGWQDIKNEVPVTASTTFMLNSSTKPITAAAILQLTEEGKIHLDSSVSSYYALHPYGEEITVCHLLSHTAGIPQPAPINWFHLAEDHENFDENRALAGVLKNSKLKSAPGEKYRYSNISYWQFSVRKRSKHFLPNKKITPGGCWRQPRGGPRENCSIANTMENPGEEGGPTAISAFTRIKGSQLYFWSIKSRSANHPSTNFPIPWIKHLYLVLNRRSHSLFSASARSIFQEKPRTSSSWG